MGRYAQSRRRGRGLPAAGGPGPPPAPTAAVDESSVSYVATGDDDTGGRVRLYQANQPVIEEASVIDERDWAASGQWDSLDPGYYWVTEVGNGVVYVGESGYSNMVTVI